MNKGEDTFSSNTKSPKCHDESRLDPKGKARTNDEKDGLKEPPKGKKFPDIGFDNDSLDKG